MSFFHERTHLYRPSCPPGEDIGPVCVFLNQDVLIHVSQNPLQLLFTEVIEVLSPVDLPQAPVAESGYVLPLAKMGRTPCSAPKEEIFSRFLNGLPVVPSDARHAPLRRKKSSAVS